MSYGARDYWIYAGPSIGVARNRPSSSAEKETLFTFGLNACDYLVSSHGRWLAASIDAVWEPAAPLARCSIGPDVGIFPVGIAGEFVFEARHGSPCKGYQWRCELNLFELMPYVAVGTLWGGGIVEHYAEFALILRKCVKSNASGYVSPWVIRGH